MAAQREEATREIDTQRRLKNLGQLAISVRHVRALLGQSEDDVPESRQGLVDVLGFSQPVPGRLRAVDPLAPGEIHQMKSAAQGSPGLQVQSADMDGEDTAVENSKRAGEEQLKMA